MTPIERHHALERIWGTGPGLQRLSAVNHTIMGRRFMIAALVFFAIGGILAMLIRTQLASAESPFMEAETYAQVFTMHGVVMMFLFAIPFFEGLAMYLLPKMLGARDMAFPRLSAYGFWCYAFGGATLVVALLLGVAPNAGWFLYPPLSSATFTPGIQSDIWLLGITFVEISAMSAAVEIVVTILKLRGAGMSLDRLPIFAWYMLIVGGMMLVGFPPLILGSLLLEAERAFGLPFFDPLRGGDPLLWQHLFWLFGHPEVYIIFLPAAGVLSTVIPVFSGTQLAGYRVVVAALVAMAFLSFGLWVHHMYTTGIPHLSLSFFSISSALVALPTAVQVFAWLGTMGTGRPRLSIPMLHVFGFFFVFVCGGLSGVMLAMVPFDMQVHDTHFVVAHLHYVLVGGFVFPMMAGAYYWLPHICGRMPVHQMSQAAFWTIFAGFNLTFLHMHLTGLLGMTRRSYRYSDPLWEVLNLVSSIGGFVTTIGFALLALDLVLLMRFGRPFRRNPWGAGTLEWTTPTPPPSYAFGAIPVIDRRADRLEVERMGADLAAGRGLLATPRGELETLGVDPITGAPRQIIFLPHPTYLPLWSALATMGVFAGMLFKVYPLAIAFAALTVGLLLCWTRGRKAPGVLDAGMGLSLPQHRSSDDPPSLWAIRLLVVADATAFASLLFGAGFLWMSAPGWPPEDPVRIGGILALPFLANAALMVLARGWAAVALQAAVLAGLAAALMRVGDATAHAAPATVMAVLSFAAVHAGIGLILGAVALRGFGRDGAIAATWHRYAGLSGMLAALFPPALSLLTGAPA
ncbi:cytochrome c oxidase subunit I [Falsirhodobacter algicola]|uniref:cytochrome-c oxidase n=1 Tax=Falsirhodobacter algicola TaxID=2692330 RepID=A0A8J8MV53_9RHOB|nr:cytochrome c oxidase subunit I [Falsirhodobacter algicola]QUS37275.1 cytochrome c oxidase subunit I [Falsirhodobacter algicola]